MSRTPEEREAARLERERRRAKREGRPLPPEPAPPAAEPEFESAPPPAEVEPHAFESPEPPPEPEFAPHAFAASDHEPLTGERPVDPQETQQFDVTLAWAGDVPAAEPASNGTGEHAAVQPTEQYDVASGWTGEHAAAAATPPVTEPEPETAPPPADPPAAGAEVPLGTRRVAAHERRTAARASRGRRGGAAPPPPPGRSALPGAPRPRGSRTLRRIAVVLAFVLVIAAAWFLISLYQPGANAGSGRVVVVQVPRGAGVSQIGDLLAARGVIDSAFFFGLRAKLSGASGDLKSGTFAMHSDMSYSSALDQLTTSPPPPPVVRVTIPEGKSRREIVPLAKQAGLRGDYLTASRSSKQLNPRRFGAPKGATLEGFLFPATYELKRGATARQLVSQQLVAFKQNLAKVNLRYARSKNLTVFDVLTIAAMVEREVMVARERPLVAAVIYNRLKDGMPLGIDATLRFELNDWVNPLKVSQLQANTPYNTRVNGGLPPGPIGNPGLASIEAAAHPAKVDYLFYVVKPGTCGEHAFSSTDAQFTQDVARYNQAREAAGGKSPTKC